MEMETRGTPYCGGRPAVKVEEGLHAPPRLSQAHPSLQWPLHAGWGCWGVLLRAKGQMYAVPLQMEEGRWVPLEPSAAPVPSGTCGGGPGLRGLTSRGPNHLEAPGPPHQPPLPPASGSGQAGPAAPPQPRPVHRQLTYDEGASYCGHDHCLGLPCRARRHSRFRLGCRQGPREGLARGMALGGGLGRNAGPGHPVVQGTVCRSPAARRTHEAAARRHSGTRGTVLPVHRPLLRYRGRPRTGRKKRMRDATRAPGRHRGGGTQMSETWPDPALRQAGKWGLRQTWPGDRRPSESASFCRGYARTPPRGPGARGSRCPAPAAAAAATFAP